MPKKPATLAAYLRKLPDAKLRAVHKTANDPAALASIAKEEGKDAEHSAAVLKAVNAEYARRFTSKPKPFAELENLFRPIED
jgi:hypothetical protein